MGSPQILGAAVGLVIGVVFVWQGALDAFFTALFMLGGWIVGKYIGGGISVVDELLERFLDSRNRDRRS
jgi:uncharacterized membrane protein